MKGTYNYTVWHKGRYDDRGKYHPAHGTRHKVRVEVLETLNSQYRVKFLAFHEDGRGPGTITAVNKSNVKLDVAPAQGDNITPAHGIDREIRKPYKED